jgi:hypothetical protein
MERRIANRWEEMPGIVAMVERFGAEHACPGQVINDVNVALDGRRHPTSACRSRCGRWAVSAFTSSRA